MSLPDFICIGAQKSGTTWLYEMLAQNPSIWLPPMKELHFFDRISLDGFGSKSTAVQQRTAARLEARATRLTRAAHASLRTTHFLRSMFKIGLAAIGHGRAPEYRKVHDKEQIEFLQSMNNHTINTEEWYRSIFSHPSSAGKVRGEITPVYLSMSEERIAYARSVLHETKIIVIVREPFDRVVSQLRMAASRSGRFVLDDATWNSLLSRTMRAQKANYATSIPLWQKYFTSERLCFLPFSEMRTDPLGFLRHVETFISVSPHDNYIAMNERIHKTDEIPIPEWVLAKLAKLTEPQKNYLITAFGHEFYENTR